jgi:hypothetical protein
MTVAALAIIVAALVVLVLCAVTWGLGRQVRRLRTEVQVLADREPVAHVQPREAATPTPGLDGDLVLRPMPLGPADVDPDPSASRVASVTLAGPLIKVASFSHGVRRALAEESRMRVAYAFRKELRRQRKVRRKRAAAGRQRLEGKGP